MKNLLFTICLLAFHSIGVLAQSNDQIVIGKMDSIDSKILGEQRKIWVYVPDGAPEKGDAKQQYPVVYLLDGDGHFFSVAGMIRQLSSINGNTICPKMIVVGIPNTNRTRDLTPSKGVPSPFVDEGMIQVSGGGENFMSFMKDELIPYIESNYSIAPFRMLIGHSFGGLTAMNAFHKYTDLFNAYIAIDPSMWWSNQQLLKEIKHTPIDEKYKGKFLYVGIANTMEEGMTIEEVRSDTAFETAHIRSILELNDYLSENAGDLVKYQSKYYNDDDHGSVPLIAEYDAIRFFFNFYRHKLEIKAIMDPTFDLSGDLKAHYSNASKKMGYPLKPDEEMLNGMGYQLMSMKQMDKAGGVFKLNTEYYPKSFNTYDSLADYYAAAGEKEKAIENYKKALSLNENPDSREKLEKLQKE